MNDIKTETIATTPTEVHHENVLSMQNNIKQETTSSTSKNNQMESLDFGEEEDDEDEYT